VRHIGHIERIDIRSIDVVSLRWRLRRVVCVIKDIIARHVGRELDSIFVRAKGVRVKLTNDSVVAKGRRIVGLGRIEPTQGGNIEVLDVLEQLVGFLRVACSDWDNARAQLESVVHDAAKVTTLGVDKCVEEMVLGSGEADSMRELEAAIFNGKELKSWCVLGVCDIPAEMLESRERSIVCCELRLRLVATARNEGAALLEVNETRTVRQDVALVVECDVGERVGDRDTFLGLGLAPSATCDRCELT